MEKIDKIIIDAENAVIGRLASYAVKQSLRGKHVAIVNAEKAIITGDPKVTENKILERLQRGSPQHGPFYPKSPDMILRRMIRGMLPYKQPKGRSAFKKLSGIVAPGLVILSYDEIASNCTVKSIDTVRL